MNDILKYWPINFDYNGLKMSIPMGEIIGIKAQPAGCTILTRGDQWTTDTTTYDDVMRQWVGAMGKCEVQP